MTKTKFEKLFKDECWEPEFCDEIRRLALIGIEAEKTNRVIDLEAENAKLSELLEAALGVLESLEDARKGNALDMVEESTWLKLSSNVAAAREALKGGGER